MKKGMLSALALVALGTGLLIGVSPSSAGTTPAYKHYIACGLSEAAKPAHVCPVNSKKGAFFKSLKAKVDYTLCLKPPRGKIECTVTPQVGKKGKLYVNKFTTPVIGRYQVTWFVGGKKVGTSALRAK